MGAADKISLDAAVASVFSGVDGIFILKNNIKTTQRARLNGLHCLALLKTGLGQSFDKLATGWCRVAVVVQEQH